MNSVKTVSVLSFVLCLVFACGNASSDKQDGTGATLPQETSEVSYTLPATTKYISEENEAGVLSIEDDGETIVFKGDSALAASIAEGDVLMFGITSHTPNGLLRKVTTRTGQGSDLVLETAQATIPEAFEKLDLMIERSLPFDEMESYETSSDGLELHRIPLTLEGSAGGTYEFEFNGTVLYDKDGDKSTTHDQVVADGALSFTLGLTLEVKTEWLSLERLKVGTEVKQESELTISTTLPALEFEKELVIADLYFGAFAVGPVVIVPNLELLLGANGELQAQVSTGMAENMSVSAGAVYEKSSWTPYSDFSSEWSFDPPSLSASARVKAYVGPRLNLMLYGVAGPYFQLDGYLELEADVGKTPWWELYVGLEAFLGIKGEILGIELLNYQSGDLLNMRKLLAAADEGPECVPHCSGIECGHGGCPDHPDSCGSCAGGEYCDGGLCVGSSCQPDCAGTECGDGGCLDLPHACGICGVEQTCQSGQCVYGPCETDCAAMECGDDGCGGSCGICGEPAKCFNGQCVCIPDCHDKDCGDDGCGSICGSCPGGDECVNGKCGCEPDCVGKQCGPDGCGGNCGSCLGQDECVYGKCECEAACSGMECGDDGCGGSCGSCSGQDTCVIGQCECLPNCAGKDCGNDGCGGTCGTCNGGWICDSGECVDTCIETCASKGWQCDEVCGELCGACAGKDDCVGGFCFCQPDCVGKQCGPDGCGGACGECQGPQHECISGSCKCQPACEGKDCGDDGCGGSCGSCSGQDKCVGGQCACQPNCSGKQCGPNGCGGSCGSCWGQDECVNGMCQCQPSCQAKDCGPDGCGDSCGSCENDEACEGGQCVKQNTPTWTDPIHSLTWQNPPTGSIETWEEAKQYCDGLSLQGGGWRLPSIAELRTLVNGCPGTEFAGECGVGVDGCVAGECWTDSCLGCSWFEGPAAGGCYWPDEIEGSCSFAPYWSSTPKGGDSGYAWCIEFGTGYITGSWVGKTWYDVRCVR